MRMQEPRPDDPELLGVAPIGTYLLELRGHTLIVWRLSEGEPPDGALESAVGWALDPAYG
jgi:hypothetical protein